MAHTPLKRKSLGAPCKTSPTKSPIGPLPYFEVLSWNIGGIGWDLRDTGMDYADLEKVMSDFVAITNTDQACAHFYLQSVDWDLQRGVTAYFETLNEVGTEIAKQEHKVYENTKGKLIDLVDSNEEEGPTSSKTRKLDPDDVKELGIVSWNIDGIEEARGEIIDRVNYTEQKKAEEKRGPNDPRGSEWKMGEKHKVFLKTRLDAILCVIDRLKPEVILLQEVVPSALAFIKDKLVEIYNVIEGDATFPYFTTILVSKNVHIEKSSFENFANTGMGRGLQTLECSYNGLSVNIINCHLESMREFSEQRKVQFTELMAALEALKEKHPEGVVLGGGDLNIRDEEISRYPDGIKDAWIESGMVAKERYTWNTSKNDNKIKGSARARFDRLYYCGPLNRAELTLHEKKDVKGVFLSYHYACSRVATIMSEHNSDTESNDVELKNLEKRMAELEKEAQHIRDIQTAFEQEIDITDISGSVTETVNAFPTIEEQEEIDSRSIYVGNVDYHTRPEELDFLFAECGDVKRVTIINDKVTGHPKGFAYVEFESRDAVPKALLMEGTIFRDRDIKVSAKRTNKPGMGASSTLRRGGRVRGGMVVKYKGGPSGRGPQNPRGRWPHA